MVFRFGVVGVVNTSLTVLLVWALSLTFLSWPAAHLTALILLMIPAFFFYSKGVFGTGDKTLLRFGKFAIFYVLLAIATTFFHGAPGEPILLEALAILCFSVVNFLALRYLVFPAQTEESGRFAPR